MPGQDGTGPNGEYVDCISPEYSNSSRRGAGFGRGRGFGGRTSYNPRGMLRQRFFRGPINEQSITKEEELSFLEEQKKILSGNLEGLEKRMKELKK
jgi:hypothetical protein